MTKKIIYLFLCMFCLVGFDAHAQDMKLWYRQPAKEWTEALPIGNGRIGAMIYGGSQSDHIQFNEETLWTNGPRDYNRKGAYKYLDTIRQLLFDGKQKEAEQLAGEKFMGTKSPSGDREAWFRKVTKNRKPSQENYDDSRWKTMYVPSYQGWEAVGFEGLDGAVWLRTYFDLPETWKGKDLALDVDKIRDQDFTYVNGKLIGSQNNLEKRNYTIPAGVLHAGKNNISILVLNYFDKGGITGYKDTTRKIGLYPLGEERLKIPLNGQWKYFIADDNPPEVGVYQASYQPFGDLFLNFQGITDTENYRRDLDISNAVASVSFTSAGVGYRREYFASQPNQAIIIHLTADKKNQINFDAVLKSEHKGFSVTRMDANTIALHVQVRNGALHGESYLRIETTAGNIRINDGRLSVRDADEATLYLTAGTNYKNYKDVSADAKLPCINALNSLKGKRYPQIKDAHIREYQQYFNTYSVGFGTTQSELLPTDIRIERFDTSDDPSLIALYQQYGRYLLISSSRPGTRPANLQGIWNNLLTPPWGSKYTTNINLEMNYWPAELLNLSPMATPLFEMIKELSQTGRETAKDYYNAPGWVLHHNTDLWRGTAAINASNHGIWVTGGAWLTDHLWEHYLFTGNKQFLKDTAYPIMKQAALFFNSFLIKDPKTGYLISTPSNSPEHGGLVAGPTMDHQIIRTLFENVIDASEILNIDVPLRTQLAEKYKRIAPNKIGRYGQLQEWMQDVDDTADKHRHISHLWGVFPGHEINWDETPDLMKAARQSLIYRGDEATGWSLAWKINCWARFKDGNHTFRLIKMLLRPAITGAGSYPNLFDAHPPFQIDGNFGGAAGIGEMLIQSQTRYVDILPALPDALPNGFVNGIRARGGFVIDMSWKDGKLSDLKIKSTIGSPLVLRYNGIIKEIKTEKNGEYHFDGNLRAI